MPIQIKHATQATTPDDPGYEIGTGEWNEDHALTPGSEGQVIKTVGGVAVWADAGGQGSTAIIERDQGEDLLMIPGPAGTAGSNGSPGAQGPAGPAVFMEAEPGEDAPIIPGPAGAQGSTGLTGSTGAAGPAGPAVYLEAEPGEDAMAIPGPAGAAGAPGSAGAAGVTGPAVYLEAEPGEDGLTIVGPQGPQGPAGGGGGSLSSTTVAFTDGDTARRVTVTDGAITGSSKILCGVRRPDTADMSADRGYVYTANVVRIGAGSFDVLMRCADLSGLDPTELPPNETVTLYYMAA